MSALWKILLVLFIVLLAIAYWPLALLVAAVAGFLIYRLGKSIKETDERRRQDCPRIGDPYDKVLAYATAFAADHLREGKFINDEPEITATMNWFGDGDCYYVAFHFTSDGTLREIYLATKERISQKTFLEYNCMELVQLPRIIKGLKSDYGITFDDIYDYNTRFWSSTGKSDSYPAHAEVAVTFTQERELCEDHFYCHYGISLYPHYPQ